MCVLMTLMSELKSEPQIAKANHVTTGVNVSLVKRRAILISTDMESVDRMAWL